VNNCMFENGNTEYMGSAATNLAAENSVSTGILANNKLVTIGANFHLTGGDIAQLHLRQIQLNQRAIIGNTINGPTKLNKLEVAGQYQKPLGNWLLKAGGAIANKDDNNQSGVDASVYIKTQYAF
ncbi:MAG: hypothetical protein WA981_15185, partial [Glaciecola sp.]